METSKTYKQLLSENQELQQHLEEANETIEAIRTGQVDALVVQNGDGHQLYTLKTADQTYRVFIEKMSEGAVTINQSGLIVYSNSRFAAMVNFPLEKVIGLDFKVFVPDDCHGDYETLIKKGLESDCKKELFITNRYGKKTCCLLSCNSIELDDGISLSLIITDLTAQKETQQKLKSQNKLLEEAQGSLEKLNNRLESTVEQRTKALLISREHFRLLANHITQMSWTNLPNGEVNFYNQRWYDYTGLSFDDIRGVGFREVVHPDDIDETIKKYNASLTSGEIFEIENRYRMGKDGSYRWHLNKAVPLRNEKGEIILWVGTATDIEDQKRELERKDEFIGVASHELKTPLTSLKGYLQLISMNKSAELTPVLKQYLLKANLAIKKLQFLIDDLLDVSKIKAGHLNYNLESVSIKSIVNDCTENAVHLYSSFNFEVHNESEFIVRGNAERLEQVLMNLINNAVKYSQGNKNMVIKTARIENQVRVSVTDFGIGLSEEQQHKIFERFYRVEDKKHMTSGLGMGLYISSVIINTHKGKIGVDSKLGEGATFYFEIPLEKD